MMTGVFVVNVGIVVSPTAMTVFVTANDAVGLRSVLH